MLILLLLPYTSVCELLPQLKPQLQRPPLSSRNFSSVLCYSDLEETLLLLPYTSVCELLPLLKPLLCRPLHSDLVCRLLVFLLRVHHRPISATPALQPLITELGLLGAARAAELRVRTITQL